MPNVSINELSGVLSKAGLSGDPTQNAGLRQNISNAAYSQDTQIPQMKNDYMGKLAKIAQMDQKLSGLYGDPSSPMYIERASSRDKARFGAMDTGLADAKMTVTQIANRKKELEDLISESVTLYKELLADEKAKEVEDKKQQSAYNKTPEGVAQKAQQDQVNAEIAQKAKLEARVKEAGITDQNAIDQFNELTDKEQDAYIRDIKAGKVDAVKNEAGENTPTTWQAISLWRDKYRGNYKKVDKTKTTDTETDLF